LGRAQGHEKETARHNRLEKPAFNSTTERSKKFIERRMPILPQGRMAQA
jgi:hypothetical protein